jgi:hypothetical protein
MAITSAPISEGTRVRIRRGVFPLDPVAIGRTGTVVDASEYRSHSYGVVLDGDEDVRFFAPPELEVVQGLALPPEREEAKGRRALP